MRRGLRRPRARASAAAPAPPALQPYRVLIRGLETMAIIGVRPRERTHRQRVLLDLVLDVATRAGATDQLADAMDYKVVKDDVLHIVQASHHHLLETLAEEVAAYCLQRPGVLAVEVTIDKPGALTSARSVAIQVRRQQMGADSGETA